VKIKQILPGASRRIMLWSQEYNIGRANRETPAERPRTSLSQLAKKPVIRSMVSSGSFEPEVVMRLQKYIFRISVKILFIFFIFS
jgi:hypothetical protein